MISKIQKEKPIRTCTTAYANHSSYKPFLREDFNKRCGYCDDSDYYCGGRRGYQIDHFRPQKNFPELKNDYSNLIYSCPFCNRSKWDKWKNSDGFIDPCKDEYDNHLERNAKGQIKYKTDQGKYIYVNLNLGLLRHELLWCIDKLQEQKNTLKLQLKGLGEEKIKELEIYRAFIKIQDKIDEYTELFQKEI